MKLAKKSDLILTVFVILVAAMLLVPLPTWLIDILITANISISLVLLLVGLYMPNALALLSFPSLLLLTTLFRLSLNVASSRLILSQADAGVVIHSFGTLLIRGEIVVGIIIFTIITIVNFIVIAKGSSRVSEVAARFALDALPGKQMAIDADLRAGSISASEAQHKREDLRKESQLYGAMDGSMKFVQGDAVAGFFIILTNIFGGLYLGVSGGMSFADAIETYTILTVGDGLVSQIPALLISICAGIVVTRVSSGENTTLAGDVGEQILARPSSLLIAGIILLALGLMPGVPFLPFFIVGLVLIATRFLVGREQKIQETKIVLGESLFSNSFLPGSPLRGLPAPRMSEFFHDETTSLSIALSKTELFQSYSEQAQRYLSWWRDFRTDVYEETGLRIPDWRVTAEEYAQGGAFSVYLNGGEIKGNEIISGSVPLDAIFVEMNPTQAELFGLEVLQEESHPITGASCFWVRSDSGVKKLMEASGIRVIDFMQYIGWRICNFASKNPEEFLSVSEVHSLLKAVEKKYPGLITDAFDKNFISVSRLTNVLCELVRQGVNIRDFTQIIESVAAYCANHGGAIDPDESFSLAGIVGFIREQKKRQILSSLLTARRTLRVISVSEVVEEIFDNSSLDEEGAKIALDPSEFEQTKRALAELLKPILSKGLLPVSILCRDDLRFKIERFIQLCDSSLRVVCYSELDKRAEIEQVGVWSI